MMWKCFAVVLLIGSVVGRGVHKRETEYETAIKQLKTVSEKYCNSTEVDKIEKGAQDAAQCFVGNFENTVRHAVLINDDADKFYIDVVKGVCKQKVPLMKCYSDFLDVLAPCVGEKGDVKTAKKLMDNMFDYVCFNDSQTIIDFIKNDGVSCVSEQSEELQDCAAIVENAKVDDSNELSLAQACDLYDKLTGCVVRELKNCPKKAASEFFSGLFEVVSETQCSTEQLLM